MAQAAGAAVGNKKDCVGDDLLNEACFLAQSLAEHIAAVIVTLGKLGVLVARRGDSSDILIQERGCPQHEIIDPSGPVCVRMYSVPRLDHVVSVSGAGDCLAAGFITAALSHLSEEQCVTVGVAAARLSLQSATAVPAKLFNVQEWQRHTVPLQCCSLQLTT